MDEVNTDIVTHDVNMVREGSVEATNDKKKNKDAEREAFELKSER